MNAIDTNIWVYCYDKRDLGKQQKARELAASVAPLVLLVIAVLARARTIEMRTAAAACVPPTWCATSTAGMSPSIRAAAL